MVEAIIFDLDGMIFFTEERWSDWFSKKYNIPNEHMQEFFQNEFKKCLTGHLDTKEELEKYFSKWNWKHSTEKLLESWFNYGQLDNDMIQLIRMLKKDGIICILCTNNEKYRINHFREKHGFEELFDYVFSSAELGYKKPEYEIFQKIVEITGIAPEETIFCDDKEENCLAAADFGFMAYHFKDILGFRDLISELQ